jgi:toxin CcdB
MMVLLRRRAALPKQPAIANSRMNPIFRIEKIDIILHPLDMVSVAVEQLGERIGSLAEHGQAIADALDELLSRS